MTILITGICGFVGTNLSASLPNHIIYGVSTDSSQKKEVVSIYTWDTLCSLPDIDVVIHLAGKAHDSKNQTEAKTYFDINIGLTRKIFDWFLRSNTKKFIFFSSVKAAADIVNGVLTENLIPSPNGPYGESKIAAEAYLNENMPTMQEIKKVYILRPCMIHGPGNKGNLNLLYSVVMKGIPWPLGAFDNRRSLTSIDNLTYIINKLIEQDIPSGVYNIADDESLSTNEIIQIICEVMSHKCRIWRMPKRLVTIGAVLGNVLHLPLNQERLQKLTENYIVSNEKIKEALGLSKLPLSAQEGLIKTIRSFKARSAL
jgi:nucleoside-diphosphate-sugar epimerase